MKVAFMGSPAFAAAVLEGILNEHEIVCVVTQPDAAVGRGQQIKFNPVKELALKHHIPVLQPEKISKDVTELQAYQPDIIVTCAFGQILRQNVLDLAPHGVINVHGSLLPRYRGAAPVQWAVINGDAKTGISIAQTELGLDCGPVICSEEIVINPEETSGELFARLPEIAIKALRRALSQIADGTATWTPQDETLVTTAPMLNKTIARLDWQQPAINLANLVRGLNPWPIAYFNLADNVVKVYRATALDGKATPGVVVKCSAKEGLVVGCGQGLLRLDLLQLPGKKVISGRDFCNGRNLLNQKLD